MFAKYCCRDILDSVKSIKHAYQPTGVEIQPASFDSFGFYSK